MGGAPGQVGPGLYGCRSWRDPTPVERRHDRVAAAALDALPPEKHSPTLRMLMEEIAQPAQARSTHDTVRLLPARARCSEHPAN